ncbi:MAG: HEAT repeat domain-containing protein, partial [Desulfamplus sp.]|nr:HEAT repeat domain-containing protein [Desulfamplus sp.]
MLEAEKMDINKLKLTVYEGNHENINAAINLLAQMKDQKTLAEIVDLLRSDEPEIRSYAVEIISRTGSFSLPQVQPLLNDNDPDIRKLAVEILRNIRLPIVEEILIQAIFNDDVNVSVAAVEALGSIGSYKAVTHLIEAIKKEPWVKCAAIKSLGEIGSMKNMVESANEAALDAILKINPDNEDNVVL